MNIKLPKFIGHRGVKDLIPENTIQSVNKAIDLNLKWVEVDVKVSKDLVPFLLHDDNLDRTTSGSGIPINYRYNELNKLDAGSCNRSSGFLCNYWVVFCCSICFPQEIFCYERITL